MIDIEKTINLRGYDPLMLTHGSGRQIWAICNHCGYSRWAKYCEYGDLCRKCNNKKPKSEEHKRKISNSLTGPKHPQFGVKGKDHFNYGKKHSEITIKNMSDSRKGEDNSFYGKQHSIESKTKIANGNKEWRLNNPDKVEEIENKKLKIRDTDEYRNKMLQQRLNQKFSRISSIEIKIRDILKSHGYFFKTQISVCDICIPDIIFLDKKIIIQCDGDYWHSYPEGTEKDREQDKILTKNGWRVIRFWEHEINKNIQDCLRRFEAIYNDIEYVPYYTQETLNEWM